VKKGRWEIGVIDDNDTTEQDLGRAFFLVLFLRSFLLLITGLLGLSLLSSWTDLSLAASESELRIRVQIRICSPVVSPHSPSNPRAPAQSSQSSSRTRLVLVLLRALDLGGTAELLGAVLPLLACTWC
jgi:hypothetical protein